MVWPMVLILAAWCSRPLALGQTAPSATPVTVQVPIAPTPVRTTNGAQLFYELHLTNFSRQTLEIARLEIHSSSVSGPVLATYESQDLDDRLLRPGLPNDAPNKRSIGAGLRAILFIQLSFDEKARFPATVWHRTTFKQTGTDGTGAEVFLDSGPVQIVSTEPIVISPPLRGGDWLAANGPSNSSLHRRALLIVDGNASIAQRFAIDWIRLGANGLPSHDDPSQNSNWWGYGSEILAVADGTVVATKDGIPENVPVATERAVPITLDTLAGNHVVVDLGGGRYATFAHLQPGSLRVSVGSKVRRGQVLGLLGNSGNSDAPHLHFHVTDGSSAMGAEGLPYRFESFQVKGALPSLLGLLDGQAWHAASSAVQRRLEIPVENTVVRFP